MSLLRNLFLFTALWAGASGCDWDKDAANRDWDFALGDARTVVVRASRARGAAIRRDGKSGRVTVEARTALLATTYHTGTATERLTPSKQWPFAFREERDGATLRLIADGEQRVDGHSYALRDLRVTVPAGVEVVLEETRLMAP